MKEDQARIKACTKRGIYVNFIDLQMWQELNDIHTRLWFVTERQVVTVTKGKSVRIAKFGIGIIHNLSFTNIAKYQHDITVQCRLMS